MGLVGSIGGNGVVVDLMWLCRVDSDAEDASTVPFPDWLRNLRVFPAIFSNRNEGVFYLLLGE